MKNWFTILLFLYSISSFAQTVVDRLVLKDGSVLEGYILRQENSGITFKSFCASIYVDLCDMSYIEDPDMSSDSIVIADVTIKDVSKNEFAKQLVGTKEIQIQEKGDMYLLKSTRQQNFSLQLADIDRVERVNNSLLGFTDVIKTKNHGKLRGNIIYIVPGRFLKIKIDNGLIYNVNYSNIESESKDFFDLTSGYIKNIPYIDVIKTQDDEVRGVISEKNYSSQPYIEIKDEQGDEKKIYTNQIVFIGKEKNKSYNKTDKKQYNPNIVVKKKSEKDNKIKINGEIATVFQTTQLLKKGSNEKCYVVELPVDPTQIVSVINDDKNERIVMFELPDGIDREDIRFFDAYFGCRKSPHDNSFSPLPSKTHDANLCWFNDAMIKPQRGLTYDFVDGNKLRFTLSMSSYYILYNVKNNTCILIKTN